MKSRHRKADKLISGVYVKTKDHGNAEQTIFLDRGNGWEKAGFGWLVPSHRGSGSQPQGS